MTEANTLGTDALEKDTWETLETRHTNKDILIAAVVTLVAWIIVKNALKKKAPISEEVAIKEATRIVTPMVDTLSPDAVDYCAKAKTDRGFYRRFLEWVIDTVLWKNR